MGLRSIIRERQQFKADPLGQHDTPRPFNQDEVDTRLGQLEDNTEWLCDLTDALLGDNEDEDSPTVWLLPANPPDVEWVEHRFNETDEEWATVPEDKRCADPKCPQCVPDLPAGAVRNRDDVYPDGNRCGGCGVVTTLDVCVKCATGATS